MSWYSAGQALWAGAGIVLTLILAQAWSRHGGVWRLLLVALACLAAPLFWSGGLLAGPAATAYIIAKNRSRYRGVLVVLVAATAWPGCSWSDFRASRSPAPIRSGNTTKNSGRVPCRRYCTPSRQLPKLWSSQTLGSTLSRPPRKQSDWSLYSQESGFGREADCGDYALEASGVVVVVGSYLLVYFFGGNFPYSSLRDLGWYNAIPQVGAAVFAAGWWQSLRPDLPHSLTRIEAVGVLGFVGLVCVLHAPRAERNLIKYAPALYPSEVEKFPIPELLRLRALYFKEEQLGRQVRAFARLTKAKSAIAHLNVSPETLRRIYGRVLVPGIPDQQRNSDVFSLIKFPPEDPARPPDLLRIHRALDDLIRPESEPRPDWLNQDEP